ncbi:hypothetical protein Hanom_Chr04g00354031 [Helianthus anomalus]
MKFSPKFSLFLFISFHFSPKKISLEHKIFFFSSTSLQKKKNSRAHPSFISL